MYMHCSLLCFHFQLQTLDPDDAWVEGRPHQGSCCAVLHMGTLCYNPRCGVNCSVHMLYRLMYMYIYRYVHPCNCTHITYMYNNRLDNTCTSAVFSLQCTHVMLVHTFCRLSVRTHIVVCIISKGSCVSILLSFVGAATTMFIAIIITCHVFQPVGLIHAGRDDCIPRILCPYDPSSYSPRGWLAEPSHAGRSHHGLQQYCHLLYTSSPFGLISR